MRLIKLGRIIRKISNLEKLNKKWVPLKASKINVKKVTVVALCLVLVFEPSDQIFHFIFDQ